MIGYICKYAPVELMAGFGEASELLLPQEDTLDLAEGYIYPSICGYAKSVLQHALKIDYDSILFTDCCDAMKRVSDVLELQPGQRVHRVSVPRLADEHGVDWYAGILERFVAQLEEEYGKTFDVAEFLEACSSPSRAESDGDYIGVMGARVPPSLMNECKELCSLPVRDLTCASQERRFDDPPDDKDRSGLLRWYANSLLEQTPCLRMEDIDARRELVSAPHLKGIIYHTVKFCDFYNFEYAGMERSLPILKLETDYTTAAAGQVKTRLEAFFESTGTLKQGNRRPPQRNAGATCFAGIDIGSTSTDAVIMDGAGKLLAQVVVPTGAKSMAAANTALESALKHASLEKADIANMITTGYGRKSVDFESGDVTEISCHAKGVSYLFPQARAVIDIGGQDSKVIRLNAGGGVADFAMNDKCAAGTGRFLELMASTLNISLQEISKLGLHWNEEVTISSMCAVFAESEVISLIAQNKETCDIVRGINQSIAGRIAGLVTRVHAEGPFVMSGGVAKNRGVLLALEQRLGAPILVAEEPQICGALGAALLAME